MPHPDRPQLDGTRSVCEDSLVLDPRLLLDPRFLGMLHRELRARLEESETEAVLWQSGFFHGLCDATRMLRADEPGEALVLSPPGPLLAMQLAPEEGAEDAFCVRGAWPERLEAEARLATLGRCELPGCWTSAGYTAGWLSGLWERDVVAIEHACAARGDAACEFRVREASAWNDDEGRNLRDPCGAFPHAELRALVEQRLSENSRPASKAFDRSSPAIHVWGPVMIMPYCGEQTAASLDVVVRDPAAREVSVVVIDLGGAILDEGFGAVALERALETVTAWGAEPILAGVSPLSAPVVHGLGRRNVVLHKDLPDAIAAAFQVAESQRHPT